MHVGVHPRTLVSRLIVYLTGSLEAAFSHHVAQLATIQAELVLEVLASLSSAYFLNFFHPMWSGESPQLSMSSCSYTSRIFDVPSGVRVAPLTRRGSALEHVPLGSSTAGSYFHSTHRCALRYSHPSSSRNSASDRGNVWYEGSGSEQRWGICGRSCAPETQAS